jgi:hypothetical protein
LIDDEDVFGLDAVGARHRNELGVRIDGDP